MSAVVAAPTCADANPHGDSASIPARARMRASPGKASRSYIAGFLTSWNERNGIKPTGDRKGKASACRPCVTSRGLRRQSGKLRLIDLIHARHEGMLGKRVGKHAAHLRGLVGIVDLHSPQPPADPRQRNALDV